jgi:hypothetical protein
MTATLDVALCTPVDLVGSPSTQYVKIDEVMDVCARLGQRLAAECADSQRTRQVLIRALLGLVEHGAPLERIMLYEVANQMPKPDEAPVEANAPQRAGAGAS